MDRSAMWVRALASCAGQVVRESASRRLLLSLWNRVFVAVWPVPFRNGTGKIMPERRHICSRLTLTLFFSLSDTQTTTPVCHYGPIPDGPPPKGRIERIGPVVTLICCCGIPGPQPWVPRASDAEDRESTDVSSTVNVKFPAQAR